MTALHWFIYASFTVLSILHAVGGDRAVVEDGLGSGESLGVTLVTTLKNSDVPVPFSLTKADVDMGVAFVLLKAIEFCINEGLYNSGKDCPEELLSFYFKQHLNLDFSLDQATRCAIRSQLYELNWPRHELSDEVWGELQRNHTETLSKLLFTIQDLHLQQQIDVDDAQVLKRWDRSSSRNNLGHFFDTELCVHHFYDVEFYHNSSETHFQTISADNSFGFIKPLANFTGRSNCSGNILLSSNYIFNSNSYWKRYDEDHYERLIHTDNLDTKNPEVSDDGVYILIQDQWFCRNVGHSIWSASLFWSMITSPLKVKIRGLHFASIEYERCIHEEAQPYIVYILHAIILAAQKFGIPIFVRDKTYAIHYLDKYDPPLYRKCDSDPLVSEPGSKYFKICNDSRHMYSNIREREPRVIYHHMIDKLQTSHFTSAGIIEMVDFILGLCDLIDIDEEDSYDVVIVNRKHARHIVNIDEVIRYLESYFLSLSAASFRQKWRVKAINLGELLPCDQVAVVRRARVFITVHGAETVQASLLRPGSVVIDAHAGCCMSDGDFEFMNFPVYKAAQLVHTYFRGTFVSSPLCNKWSNAMHLSFYCGTFVNITMFNELFESLKTYLGTILSTKSWFKHKK